MVPGWHQQNRFKYTQIQRETNYKSCPSSQSVTQISCSLRTTLEEARKAQINKLKFNTAPSSCPCLSSLFFHSVWGQNRYDKFIKFYWFKPPTPHSKRKQTLCWKGSLGNDSRNIQQMMPLNHSKITVREYIAFISFPWGSCPHLAYYTARSDLSSPMTLYSSYQPSLYSSPIMHFRCGCRNLRSCWQIQIWQSFHNRKKKVNAFVSLLKTYLRRERSLYRRAHCADRELCLIGHDVGWLDVAVIHWVLKGRPSICVLVTRVPIEGNFGSFSESKTEQSFIFYTAKDSLNNWWGVISSSILLIALPVFVEIESKACYDHGNKRH